MFHRTLRAFTGGLILAALCLGGWPSPLFGEEEEDPQSVDVFFVVDNSGSMRRLDPGGLRVAYSHSLTDLVLSRGGDWVSVVRLGGRLESAEWNPIVFPLKRVPKEHEARAAVLEEVKKALAAEAKGFGRGSDFNAALEIGVLPQRTKRTAVIIVVSDGNMEVIEGDRAPEIYLKEAAEIDGPTMRDRVNAAAMKRFRILNLPVLANPHPELKTFVIPVGVGSAEGEGRYVLK
ncbi:MAG: vWA domain-containing protein, partial [Planctomycetota bacterium]